MKLGRRSAVRWRYPGMTAQAFAAVCIESAADYGFTLVIRPDTPVIPDEGHHWLTTRGTWADIDALAREWSALGCSWVNLRFALDDTGTALVRYEARVDDEPEPLGEGRLPWINGGFDVHRLLPREQWERRGDRTAEP